MSDLDQIKSAAEQVASAKSYQDIQNQISILERMRQQVKENSDDQRAIDAVLHKDRQTELQDYDNLLSQSNRVGDGLKLFFTQYANDAKTASQQVSEVMTSTMNSIQGSLTKFITGQRNAFKGLGQTIEQSLAKTAVQDVLKKAVGGIGSLFGIKGPGAKRDGSTKSNAMYVTNVPDGAGGAVAGAAGGSLLGALSGSGGSGGSGAGGASSGGHMTGASGALSSVFGSFLKPFESLLKPVFGLLNNSNFFGGLDGGKLFGSGGFFGGFMANGGDVSPGKAYIVGEKKPELFLPSSAGRIVPNFSNAPAQSSTTVNAHFHGVTDADSFRKSQNQIASTLGNAVQRAQQRGR